MMSIGLIRHRSICSGRCGDDHRMRRYWWRWRCVLAKPLHGCRRRSSEPTVPASLPDLLVFSAEEARQFLGAAVDEKAAAWLYGESGGNLFYLQQLARPAESAPVGTRDEGGTAGVDVPPRW